MSGTFINSFSWPLVVKYMDVFHNLTMREAENDLLPMTYVQLHIVRIDLTKTINLNLEIFRK